MKKQLDFRQYQELKKLGYIGGITIGDLIEFLDEHQIAKEEICTQSLSISLDYGEHSSGKDKWTLYFCCYDINSAELCDALWKAVKEVLEK